MDFVVLALEDSRLASIGNFLDAFSIASNQVARIFSSRSDTGMETRIRLLSPGGRPVRTADGRTIASDGGLNDHLGAMLVHVAAFAGRTETNLVARLAEQGDVLAWLQDCHAAGALISAAGPSVFLLAEAGLLSGGVAAVQRSLTPLFHQRYPGIRIDRRAPVVEYGTVLTVMGLSAEFQLMKRLVERSMSPEMAGWLGRVTGLDGLEDGALATDPLVANAQVWLSERFAEDPKIADLAAAMAVSHQTLIRHFRSHLGKTPREYLQLLRIQAAQSQLLHSTRSIAEIATRVGYDDMKSFRTAFRAITGQSASTFRSLGADRSGETTQPD